MHYPDYSQLWLDDVKNGRATALASSPESSAQQAQTAVALDGLQASNALGEKIQLGSWNDAPLTWTVISVDRDMALLLCDTIVAAQQLFQGPIDPHAPGWWCETPSWNDADIRKWLNLTFMSQAFDFNDRVYIQPAFGDKSPNPDMVKVLSAEEAQTYVPQDLRACMDTPWWLRDPSSWGQDGEPTYVSEAGALCTGGTAHAFRGIRPLITVKFW